MGIDFFIDILNIDSTTGRERALADFLCSSLNHLDCQVLRFPPDAHADQPVNLLFKWGEPFITFCTHLDTVPPYIPPTVVCDGNGNPIAIRGRGTCDAKGQIFAMLNACTELAHRGETGMALLLLYGEETGSFGAKEFRTQPGSEFVIVGEPTDNLMASASKGTKSFNVAITGKPCHSGYPENGLSAIDVFIDLINKIRGFDLPVDTILGPTTFNIGQLVSDNPQNILCPKLSCRIYFRTTFASDELVCKKMAELVDSNINITNLGGDAPSRYFTIDDMAKTVVAFGSDAPQLSNYRHKALMGPGSILVAHTADENILLSDLNKATQNYIDIFYNVKDYITQSVNSIIF